MQARGRAHAAFLDRGGSAARRAQRRVAGVRGLLEKPASAGPGRPDGWRERRRLRRGTFGAPCVEQGYLLLPAGRGCWSAASRQAHAGARRPRSASASATRTSSPSPQPAGPGAAGPGAGRAGLALLDEVMVAVTADELSAGRDRPRVLRRHRRSCHDMFDLRRARSGPGVAAGATRNRTWCRSAAMPGPPIGADADAGGVARGHRGGPRARASACRTARRRRAGARAYQQAEIYRLRGEVEPPPRRPTAGPARPGVEPQPGLALLRLAQGDAEAAVPRIRRALGANERFARSAPGLSAAACEILLAVGDSPLARAAARAGGARPAP